MTESARNGIDELVETALSAASAAAVWQALTTGRESWWPDLAFEPHVGSSVRETWIEDGRQCAAEGVVTRVEAPRLLAFEWSEPGWTAPLTVEVRIADAGDAGSTITLTERGFAALAAGSLLHEAHRDGWRFHVRGLVRAAETGL